MRREDDRIALSNLGITLSHYKETLVELVAKVNSLQHSQEIGLERIAMAITSQLDAVVKRLNLEEQATVEINTTVRVSRFWLGLLLSIVLGLQSFTFWWFVRTQNSFDELTTIKAQVSFLLQPRKTP